MKTILLFGAGLSASSLIKYLLEHSKELDWQVIIADRDVELVKSKINGHDRGECLVLDISNNQERKVGIERADIVISMLPAFLHTVVAKDCLELKKHLVTASYCSEEMLAMDDEAKEAGIVMMNEIGLDPGIDHMSAMKIIDELKAKGASIESFKSYCGGLVAPEFDNNPWNYKFTWNPRNVVLAGQGMSQFISNGQYKYVPYSRLFTRVETFNVLNFGLFEAYANRDSLSYRSVYGLEEIPTIFRGTLRRSGYSRAWDMFVQLGLTDDTFVIENSKTMTYREFVNSFLFFRREDSVELKMAYYLNIPLESDEMQKLTWLGIFENKAIGLDRATPAQILQKILEEKLSLEENDIDMIVMHHEFEYILNGDRGKVKSSMMLKGDDQTYTAMSNTVGLPLAIFVKLFLTGKIDITGVHVPVMKEVYEPVLEELKEYGVNFIEFDSLM